MHMPKDGNINDGKPQRIILPYRKKGVLMVPRAKFYFIKFLYILRLSVPKDCKHSTINDETKIMQLIDFKFFIF